MATSDPHNPSRTIDPLPDTPERKSDGEGEKRVDRNATTILQVCGSGDSTLLPERKQLPHEKGARGADPGIPAAAAVTCPRIGDYEILAEIARGGMGVVYKARHVGLGRLAALKLIRSGDSASPEEVRRFQAEGEAAARMDHPGIVPVYEVGRHDGQYYMALAFVEGQSLWQRVQRAPLEPRDAAGLMKQVAEAVQYAHDHGIVHRDLKPQNILMGDGGIPRVTDFGLAKRTQTDSSLTATGQILGTPSYMPPEQASGKTELVGPRSDVYSLGATLYCLIVGRPPFQAANVMETLKQVLEDEPIAPQLLNRAIPRDLATICLKAMAKEPALRYDSAGSLALDLKRFLAGDAILARPEGRLARWRRKLRKNRTGATAIAGVLLVVLIAVAMITSVGRVAKRRGLLESELQGREQSLTAWNVAEVEKHEGLLAELESLAPESLPAACDRFAQAMSATALKRTQSAVLQPDDDDYVTEIVAFLRPRDLQRANALEAALKTRQRAWDAVFQERPFQRQAPGSALDGFAHLPRAWLTAQSSSGNVKAEAEWVDWDSGSALGLLLQGDSSARRAGYAFVVHFPGTSSAEAPQGGSRPAAAKGEALVQIWRGDIKLRETVLPRTQLQGPTLRMEASRIGDEVKLQINGQPPIAFRDLFPIPPSGVFGIIGPSEIEVRSFRGWRQPLPALPSPFEVADNLYAQGKLQEARDQYQRQSVALAGTDDAQAAQFKLGLTLQKLGDRPAALQQYEALAAQTGSRWPLLAAIHLWASYVEDKDYTRSEEVFTAFVSHRIGSATDLAAIAPFELRGPIVKYYNETAGSFGYLQPDPRRVEKAERLVQVEELWDVPPISHGWSQLQLLRAYRWEGRTDQAIQRVRLWLDALPDDDPIFGVLFTAELGWLLREKEQAERASGEIEKRLYDASGILRPSTMPLLVERARVLIATGKRAEAEAVLEEFLQLGVPGAQAHRSHSDACLLLGLLREKRGDVVGAQAAWSQGDMPFDPSHPEALNALGGMTGVLNAVVLGTLSGTLDDPKTEVFLRETVRRSRGGEAALRVGGEGLVRTGGQAMRRMWMSSEGKELAWKMACQDISFVDYVRLPVQEFAVEFANLDLFAGGSTAEQRDIVHQFAGVLFDALQSGELGYAHLPFFASAYKYGNTGPLGWGFVAASLKAKLRGPLAYLLAFRFRRLGRPEADVRNLFDTASRDASADSLLQRLAREELNRGSAE